MQICSRLLQHEVSRHTHRGRRLTASPKKTKDWISGWLSSEADQLTIRSFKRCKRSKSIFDGLINRWPFSNFRQRMPYWRYRFLGWPKQHSASRDKNTYRTSSAYTAVVKTTQNIWCENTSEEPFKPAVMLLLASDRRWINSIYFSAYLFSY